MRFDRLVPLALATGSGLAAAGLLYAYMAEAAAQPAALPQETMVVAAAGIAQARALTDADLMVVAIPQRPNGAFADLVALRGRQTLVSVPRGQPLLTSHLAPEGSAPALWSRIPPGKRAVTVAVNEVAGVAGFLKPGHNVDVIGVLHGDQGWGSRTIAQDVPVLAIAQDDKDGRDPASAHVVGSATLLVSPQQAEAIILAGEEGRIRLVLLGPTDHKVLKQAPLPKPKPKPVAQVAAPVRLAPPPPQIVVRYAPAPAPRMAAPRPAPPQVVPNTIDVIQGERREAIHP